MEPRDSATAEKACPKECPRDSDFDAWAQRLQAQADQFIRNKQPDRLDALSFLLALEVNHNG